MSRGRGGPYKEHYHRHPLPDSQAERNYYRPGPALHYHRAGPQQSPYLGYYNRFNHPVGPIQPPPAPSLNPSAPPLPKHIQAAPKPDAPNSPHNQNHSPGPAPNSFQYQQAEFLRGQISEAPQFRACPRGGGGGVGPDRWPTPSYQPQSGHGRYSSYSNSSQRGRAGFSQDQSYQRAQRGPTNSQYSSTPRHLTQGSLCDSFQNLSLHRDRPNRGRGERFERHSASSSSASSGFSKVDITLTSGVQDQVQRALVALKPSESIPAKSLAKRLRLPKSIINKTLYALERSQKASKQGLHPPEWSVYRDPLRGEGDHKAQSPTSLPGVSPGHPPESKAKVELKTEAAENRGQSKEEDSDTESSSSYCSSSESSDSEKSQSPEKGQRQENQPPIATSSRDLEMPTMAEQKERVLQFLLVSREATALVIAKNLGLKSTKQVNPSLYSLEKQGEVIKNTEVNPPTWELSTHRRDKMERSLKAAKSSQADGDQMMVETGSDEKGGQSVFLPPSPLPPRTGLESLPLSEGWMPEQSQSEAPLSLTCCEDEETNEGQWATDDIPEFLNAIRRETDAGKLEAENVNSMGTVAVSLAAPPPQNLWAKLQEVRLKNPVSGLMEYAQYLGQNCEFLLLDQSGPSHDPRFRMQVMLNGRLFPVAEASSKKVAKKDAAAATLRILIGEMQGGPSTGDEGNAVSGVQVMDLLPDNSGLAEGTGGIYGTSTVEGMGTVEGPRQPLSRSLPGGKNPVSVLMEYSQRSGNPIEFIITGQAGPPHDPRFMYRVKVGESLFAEASAPSKKAARQLAAEEAVKELMADGRLQLNKPQLPLGSSSDSDGSGTGTTCPSLPPLTADELRAAHEAGVGDLINHLNNNAVSGLLEYARARGFAAEIRLVGQSGPPHEPKFTYQAKLGGRWFPPVCASNKKQGKQEAADAALRVLIGEAERAARTGELIPAELPVSGSTLHDQIAMLSHQRFNALTTRIQHSLLGRKILATIVMRRDTSGTGRAEVLEDWNEKPWISPIIYLCFYIDSLMSQPPRSTIFQFLLVYFGVFPLLFLPFWLDVHH